MTQPNHESPLPPHVERELAEWELLEPSAEDFDAMARAVERRIENVTPGRGDDGDWLFRAPLPLVNGERVLREDEAEAAIEPAVEVFREREPDSDHMSLKDIAEAAVRGSRREPTSFPARSPAQSGIQLIAIANTVTAPGESMRPRDAKPGPATLAQGPSVTSATSGTGAAANQRKLPRSLYGALSALAIAAAVVLWFSGNSPRTAATEGAHAAMADTVPVSAGKPAAALRVDERAPSQPGHEVAAVEQPAVDTTDPVDPNTLPTEPPRRVASAGGARAAARPAPVPDAPAAAPPATAAEPRLVPAADLGSQPKHPSLGAAQAAVGSTLGSARLCLVGQLSPSQATVIFASTGRVASVRVSGPAAGSPAEECIQRAMGSARVQPFTDETFSVRTTVRP